MTVKTWVLGRMNRMNRRSPQPAAMHDRQGRGRGALDGGDEPREPTVRGFHDGRDSVARTAEHLGPYGALIGAIRDELEQFAAGALRLHLAIAERDRYLLTSIAVDCDGSDEHRELLRRFAREFRPEQIKHYLAKEVIAGLRNAGAIDLSQFAGLDTDAHDDADDDAYGALIDELSRVPSPTPAPPYKVTLVGRWSETAAATPAGTARVVDTPQTPLAGRTLTLGIEDADGARRVAIAAVMPGRRYVVGKDEGCDIVANGVYASRRHCEIWLEQGAWRVADCGSTNGIRVETARGVVGRSDPNAPGRPSAVEVPPGATIVLSAHAAGDTRSYPRIALFAAEADDDATAAPGASTKTPVTPIAPPRRRDGALALTANMASGTRSVELRDGALPFGVGRSRNQALVVDWAHEDVSGHHIDIVALDAGGATVVVHGDNGVRVGNALHGPGTRFHWKSGETLVLGSGIAKGTACTLTLGAKS